MEWDYAVVLDVVDTGSRVRVVTELLEGYCGGDV